MIPPLHSLVKYDNPRLVKSDTKSKVRSSPYQFTALSPVPTPILGFQKPDLPPVVAAKPTQTEDILNSILPPREWSEDGQLWMQYVSSTPATRLDVINLQVSLHGILCK